MTTDHPLILALNNGAVAVLVPVNAAPRRHRLRSPRDPLLVAERTAGIFRHAARRPPATVAEETNVFEQGVAGEVVRSAGG